MHNRSMAKETMMKEKARRVGLEKINPSCWLRRVMGSRRRTPKSGVGSAKSPSATPMNVAQNSH
jgi:hypothetical protein